MSVGPTDDVCPACGNKTLRVLLNPANRAHNPNLGVYWKCLTCTQVLVGRESKEIPCCPTVSSRIVI